MNPFRVYLDPAEIGNDGYPYAWHGLYPAARDGLIPAEEPAIKHLVRELAEHRCVRCHHPFVVGETPGRWSPCDDMCAHGGPTRWMEAEYSEDEPRRVEAEWRILTVHHLNGVKHDCRWWNLVALCQRDHLLIQAKVHMQRRWNKEHTEWFKPYAAGYYAWAILGEELTREQTIERLDELLALEHNQDRLPGLDL